MSEVRWCVCQTKGFQEKLALENLQRQGFDAYLPLQLVTQRPRGQPPRTVSLPLFPRYLFVHVDLSLNGWRALYSTRGVQSVLGANARPSPILDRLVSDIQAREIKGFIELTPPELLTEVPCPWEVGQAVSYGGYLDAIFQERVDDRRCRILVSLLGAESQPLVDIADLESRGVRQQ